MNKRIIKNVFPKTLPVMAGYLVLGFGFGLLLQSKGYNFIWAIAMSVFIYGGSLQYASVNLLTSGASLITTAIMSVMIQARHLFYGVSMLSKYRKTGKEKPYIIFGLTDETYSLVCSENVPDGMDSGKYYFWISAFNQMYWVIGSTIGSLFGQMIHINTKGVDFSMTALFVVIFTDKLIKKESRLSAIFGLFISVICLLIFGAEKFLIPSMFGITVALLLAKPLLENIAEGQNDESDA